MTNPIDHHYELSENAIYQELDGKIVLLNIDSSQYYGLNRVGSEIFKLLLSSQSGQAVVQKVCDTYDAGEETVRGDLTALVQGLHDAGLVHAVGA